MKYIDLRQAGGQLTILGGALSLPTSDNTVPGTIVTGSIRYNISSERIEIWNGVAWIDLIFSGVPYDVYGTFIGQPADNQILWRIVFARTVSFSATLPGSIAVCLNAPASDISLPIYKNNTQIGSINFASSSVSGTFTFPIDIVFSSGDIMEINGPSPLDNSFISPSWSFIGVRA